MELGAAETPSQEEFQPPKEVVEAAPLTAEEAKKVLDEVWKRVRTQTRPACVLPVKNEADRKTWRVVRVFVSSTFTDFFSEREVLVKQVFPKLRAWCLERRLFLIEVDLRWGVPRDSSSESVLRSCLGELDRCRHENVQPFFLNLLGNRSA